MRPIDFFLRGAARFPDETALTDGIRHLSYRQLADEVAALAAELQKHDPEPGSRVGLFGTNSVDYVIGLLATLRAGKVWVPFLPSNGSIEARRIQDFTGLSIVLGDEPGLALLDGVEGLARLRLAPGGLGSTGGAIAANIGRGSVDCLRSRDDTAAIKFTGGSTGTPKGVMQPDRAWIAYTAMLVHHLGFQPGERTLIATPITHGASVFVLPTLATGGTIEIHASADADEIVAALRAGAARTFAPPALINKLTAAAGGGSPADYPRLRQILYSAAPMAGDDILAAQAAFGPRLATAFGQTEAPLMITYLSPEEMGDPALHGTVGRDALLSRSAILSSDGEILPAGELGEIAVRGDLVMTGYWQRPDLTDQTIVDGWLRTGDLGIRDERGYVSIKGRAREMINTGGFKVFPGDVEAVLREHSAVADCAVFGRPDRRWGEAVNAMVVLKGDSLDAADALKAYVRAQLGPVRTPKTIVIADAIPRNAQGKLQRHLLAEEVGDG